MDDINKFFDKPLNLKGMNIAVVGSSYCLINKSNGKLIDSHDHVVRFNLAPINGYEKHVGFREDFRVINNGQYYLWERTREIHNSKIIFQNPRNITYGADRDRYLHKSSTVYISDPKQVPLLKKKLDFKSSRIPSSGIYFVMMCVDSGIVPTLFGFDFENIPYQHYWEKESIPSGDATDIPYEKTFLTKLLAEGKIKTGNYENL